MIVHYANREFPVKLKAKTFRLIKDKDPSHEVEFQVKLKAERFKLIKDPSYEVKAIPKSKRCCEFPKCPRLKHKLQILCEWKNWIIEKSSLFCHEIDYIGRESTSHYEMDDMAFAAIIVSFVSIVCLFILFYR